jgi:hypothetical protein
VPRRATQTKSAAAERSTAKLTEEAADAGNGNGSVAEEEALTSRFGDEEPFTLEVGIRGVTPLLFNRMDIEAYDQENPIGGKKRPRNRPSYESMVWRTDDGYLALPTINVVRSMVAAGRYYRSPISTNPRHSASSTLTECLAPSTEYTRFDHKDWDAVDFRLARHGDAKRTPKPTYRPRLEPGWLLGPEEGQGISIIVQLPELYSPTKLLEILTRAGQLCGVGDGRKLGFGRYVIAWSRVTEGVPWS